LGEILLRKDPLHFWGNITDTMRYAGGGLGLPWPQCLHSSPRRRVTVSSGFALAFVKWGK